MSINELAYKHVSQPERQNTLHFPVLHSCHIHNLIKNHQQKAFLDINSCPASSSNSAWLYTLRNKHVP